MNDEREAHGVPAPDAAGRLVDTVSSRDRGTRSVHPRAPFTMRELHAHARWILPVIAALFMILAVLAALNALPWDRPITEWIADHRTSGLNDFWRTITELGANELVFVVVVACAVLAWPRCRPLAISIVVVALALPVIVFVLKEIIARDRPPASLAIHHPDGYSFPSGHPFAVAASWGFIPLVVALYTRRRWIWWATVIVVWSMVAVVAASRVYLGAHWTTDVIGALSLAVVFVAGSEALIGWLHQHNAPAVLQCDADLRPASKDQLGPG